MNVNCTVLYRRAYVRDVTSGRKRTTISSACSCYVNTRVYVSCGSATSLF